MSNPARKEQLLKMLEQEPNDVFLNYALAMELVSENDLNGAKMQLKKTLDFNTTYLPCFYQLGQVSEKLNEISEAVNYYQKGVVVAKSQNNTKALGELNEALWMLED